VRAINAFLEPVVTPALAQPRYRAEHVTTLDGVTTRIRNDITDPGAIQAYGHGVPVIVQTMTRTMPGWNHWNATHMITVFAFDFSHNNPALDTVTYAETPSPLAGYRGPDFPDHLGERPVGRDAGLQSRVPGRSDERHQLSGPALA